MTNNGKAIELELPHLGLLRIEGPDALTFLQSQLTSDVAALTDEQQAQWTGYCNPKGRLFFTGWLARTSVEPSVFLLMLDRSLTQAMLKRLRMFILRAKVSVEDLSERTSFVGHMSFTDSLESAHQMPPSMNRIRLPDAKTHRGSPIHRSIDCLTEKEDLPTCNKPDYDHTGLWHWVHQLAAEAWINATLSERFVPQMINFERIGGVNFRKGCYPGQEVVARSQYLGKLKRRSQLYRIDDAEQALPEQGQELGEASNPELTVIQSTVCPGALGSTLWDVANGGMAAGSMSDSHKQAPHALVFAEGRIDISSDMIGPVVPLPYTLQDEV